MSRTGFPPSARLSTVLVLATLPWWAGEPAAADPNPPQVCVIIPQETICVYDDTCLVVDNQSWLCVRFRLYETTWCVTVTIDPPIPGVWMRVDACFPQDPLVTTQNIFMDQSLGCLYDYCE